MRSEPIVFTYKSNPLSRLLLQANATWLPSGENVGATSWPGRLVNGASLTDEKSCGLELLLTQSRAAVKDRIQIENMTTAATKSLVRWALLNPIAFAGSTDGEVVVDGGFPAATAVGADGGGESSLLAEDGSSLSALTLTEARNRYPRRGSVST